MVYYFSIADKSLHLPTTCFQGGCHTPPFATALLRGLRVLGVLSLEVLVFKTPLLSMGAKTALNMRAKIALRLGAKTALEVPK